MNEELSKAIINRAKAVANRYLELEELMNAPEIAADSRLFMSLAKEKRNLAKIAGAYEEYENALKIRKEWELLLENGELERGLILAEREKSDAELSDIELKIKALLLPESSSDMRPAIVELKANEAKDGEFLGKILGAYLAFAEERKYDAEVVSFDGTDIKSPTQAVIRLNTVGAFGALRLENGLHRAIFGKKGTSVVSVLVMPIDSEDELRINEKDLRIDIFHSSGAGGQNINKVETAVRITHIPTGIVVACQNERSQLQNRAKAREILAARLAEYQREEQLNKRKGEKQTAKSKMHVIRTYDFTLGAVTDESGFSVPLQRVLEGRLDELLSAAALREI